MRKKKLNTTKEPLYANIAMYSPNGKLISYSRPHTMERYINNGWAEKINENSFRLKIVSKRLSGLHGDEEYKKTFQKNKCCVCGVENVGLTRHHILPYMFYKFFTKDEKDFLVCDTTPICVDCHSKYENEADKLKLKLQQKHSDKFAAKSEWAKFKDALWFLRNFQKWKHPRTPPEVIVRRLQWVRDALNYPSEVTEENIPQIVEKYRPELDKKSKITEGGNKVVEALGKREFVRLWRQHFLDCMKPKFMHPLWSVDRHLDKIANKGENNGSI